MYYIHSDIKHCTEEIQKLTADFAAMKLQLKDTKNELDHTQKSLGDIINQMKSRNLQMLQRKSCEMEEFNKHTTTDTLSLAEEIEAIKAWNYPTHWHLFRRNYLLLSQMLFQLLLILNPILSLKQRLVVSSTLQVFVSYITLF